jgi:hypothetical protein
MLTRKTIRCLIGMLALAGACHFGLGEHVAFAQNSPKQAEKATERVRLIMRSGKVIEGELISEGATSVRIRYVEAGIKAEIDYSKADILSLTRIGPVEGAPAKSEEPVKQPVMVAVVPPSGSGSTNLYWIDLEGKFGEQITQTPIRDAIRDAKKNNADVIVLYMNADFSENPLEQLPDDAANFDEIFRAEDIVPIFTQEIPRIWEDEPGKPRVVFWVRQAMAGAALLPLVCREIYFHSEGRLGGLGNLSFIFEGVGDEMVREKQRSLRLAHAEGWANAGGYDYRLVRAMARAEYVLSVRYVNGRPELFEGYPQNPGEELLTDDGKDANADSLRERVTGMGNDVLTLNARRAQLLGVSKGTVDTREDLLVALGIDRTYREASGRSKQIMKDWATGLDNAKRTLRRLWQEEYPQVRVDEPNNYQNRTKARGQRKRILEQMKDILRRWGEGITPRWRNENQIPTLDYIDYLLDQIRIEQLKDRK